MVLTDTTDVGSPRLRDLIERLDAGEVRALDEFWTDVRAEGTPLVEPIADSPDEVLVTFLYQGGRRVKGVRVFGGPSGGGDHRMRRILGTDLWYTTFRVPNDLRSLYKLEVTRSTALGRPSETWELDPLNPKVFETAFPNSEGWSDSVVELSGAVPHPWIVPDPDIPAGTIEEHLVDSEITGYQRRVWIYTPAGYAPEKDPYPLLLLLDGQAYVACGRAPTTLDNLIAAGTIPPTVCVMVSIPEDEPAARLEMYACSEAFNEFLARELVPWIRSRVAVSVDPRWNTVGGSSMGGLAAAFVGLNLYFLFGNVLSQSGSYWWRPPEYPEHEWLTRQYVLAPQRPLRFFMCVGELETVATPGNGPTQVVSNRHMRDVLEARGYRVTYAEYNEGHNFLSWRGSLGEGLANLFGADEAIEEQGRDDPGLVVGLAAAASR